jgi:anthranilate synthase component I
VKDPWEAFAERAATADVAGYFERPAGAGERTGVCVSFTRSDTVLTLTPNTDVETVAATSNRFLRSHPRSAVLGYAGFDALGLFEPALRTFPGGSPFPLGEFALVSEARVERPPARPAPLPVRPRVLKTPRDSMPRDRFVASVGHLRRDIRNGEAYQVVLAHRRDWERPPDLLERAGRLRATERYAFFYYLKFGDRELTGASPESVVEVDGPRAVINPIAGTLPADGATRGRLPLEGDPKELAEHRMLVDLARNDLGRVARPGSVHLIRAEQRVRYARLEHLVSHVGARLRPEVGPWEALAATFPAGTVSGAPKIRATELLRREEGTWRGPYAGTVGLLRPGGRAYWALAIRSGFAAGRRLYTAAGAGIVYRSQPAREFHETLVKLAHVEDTLVGGAG